MRQFPLLTEEEIEALRRAYRKSPIILDVEEELEHGIIEGKRWRSRDLSDRQLLRRNLGRVYRMWCYLIARGSENEQLAVWKKCQIAKIRLSPQTDLPLAMIRLFLRVEGDRASRYGMALREAALRGVLPETLPAQLAKKGRTINDLRDAYKSRHAIRKTLSESRDANGPKPSASVVGEKNNRFAVNKTGNELRQDEKDDVPSIEWGPKALELFRKANKDALLPLAILKTGAGRVKI